MNAVKTFWSKSKPLQGARLWRYALPLRWPLTTHPPALPFPRQNSGLKKQQPMRRGLLLQLHCAHGRTAWGEIAPLPALHKETLLEAKLQIQRLLHTLVSTHDSRGLEDALAHFSEPLLASVRFGLETALWQLGPQRFGLQSLEGALPAALETGRQPPHSNMLISALIPPGTQSAMLEHVLHRHGQGWRSIKVKVGHLPPALAAELTGKIHRTCGQSLKVRLDVGRGWTLPQALQFGSCVQPHWVEYVEEPLQNPHHIPRLHAQTGLWCALDETIQQQPLHAFIQLRGVRAWVIKPALLHGGLEHFFQLVRVAHKHSIMPVVSSCFESAVGLGVLALLATTHPALRSAALGLGTADWFV